MRSVKSCCCGCSSRTGALILLSIGLMCGSLGFIANIAMVNSSTIIWSILINTFTIIISVAGIYSVLKEKPSFLVPYLIVQALGLVAMVILLVLFPFFAEDVFNELLTSVSANSAADLGAVVTAEIGFLVIGALGYYLFIIVLTCYKELEEQTRQESKLTLVQCTKSNL